MDIEPKAGEFWKYGPTDIYRIKAVNENDIALERVVGQALEDMGHPYRKDVWRETSNWTKVDMPESLERIVCPKCEQRSFGKTHKDYLCDECRYGII
jgi:hypothetical protein